MLLTKYNFNFEELVSDNAAYYGNRSAAYLALGKHKDAINDAKIATSIDENYVKV